MSVQKRIFARLLYDPACAETTWKFPNGLWCQNTSHGKTVLDNDKVTTGY